VFILLQQFLFYICVLEVVTTVATSPFIVARQCRRAELGRRRRRRSNVAKGQGMGATGCWCPGEADARVGGEDEGLQRR
jgi:hypothetical protein